MNVLDKIMVRPNHYAEYGEATWDPNDRSVRNRFIPFSPRKSSEVPTYDMEKLIEVGARNDAFDDAEAFAMIKHLTDMLARRHP